MNEYIYIYTHGVIYYAIIYYDLSQGEASCPSDLGVVPFDALPMVPGSHKKGGDLKVIKIENDYSSKGCTVFVICF